MLRDNVIKSLNEKFGKELGDDIFYTPMWKVSVDTDENGVIAFLLESYNYDCDKHTGFAGYQDFNSYDEFIEKLSHCEYIDELFFNPKPCMCMYG